VQTTTALIDSGFSSEAAIKAIESDSQSNPRGVRILAAMQREHHSRTVAQLEQHAEPCAPAPDAPFAEQMRHRTATAAGSALYKLRRQTVESVFGIIKAAMGFPTL